MVFFRGVSFFFVNGIWWVCRNFCQKYFQPKWNFHQLLLNSENFFSYLDSGRKLRNFNFGEFFFFFFSSQPSYFNKILLPAEILDDPKIFFVEKFCQKVFEQISEHFFLTLFFFSNIIIFPNFRQNCVKHDSLWRVQAPKKERVRCHKYLTLPPFRQKF